MFVLVRHLLISSYAATLFHVHKHIHTCIFSVSPESSVEVQVTNNSVLFDPNESTVLNCFASGGPNNTFEWLLDGDLIENASDTLTLDEVVGGEYTCRVSNAAGSGSASITLTGKY